LSIDFQSECGTIYLFSLNFKLIEILFLCLDVVHNGFLLVLCKIGSCFLIEKLLVLLRAIGAIEHIKFYSKILNIIILENFKTNPIASYHTAN
jgi:hypothetical protein